MRRQGLEGCEVAITEEIRGSLDAETSDAGVSGTGHQDYSRHPVYAGGGRGFSDNHSGKGPGEKSESLSPPPSSFFTINSYMFT